MRGGSRAAAPNNLPVEVSSFIGRDGDISRGVALLAETRLLTLTGAGGCGKTRLAQRIAGRVLHRYPGGVWWTELASLADEGLIADAVAEYSPDEREQILGGNAARFYKVLPPEGGSYGIHNGSYGVHR